MKSTPKQRHVWERLRDSKGHFLPIPKPDEALKEAVKEAIHEAEETGPGIPLNLEWKEPLLDSIRVIFKEEVAAHMRFFKALDSRAIRSGKNESFHKGLLWGLFLGLAVVLLLHATVLRQPKAPSTEPGKPPAPENPAQLDATLPPLSLEPVPQIFVPESLPDLPGEGFSNGKRVWR